MTAGSRLFASDGAAASVTMPVRPSRRSLASRCTPSTARNAFSISGSSAFASAVAMRRPRSRVNRRKPRRSSTWASVLLTAGCETRSRRAASVTDPASITQRTTSRCRKFDCITIWL